MFDSSGTIVAVEVSIREAGRPGPSDSYRPALVTAATCPNREFGPSMGKFHPTDLDHLTILTRKSITNVLSYMLMLSPQGYQRHHSRLIKLLVNKLNQPIHMQLQHPLHHLDRLHTIIPSLANPSNSIL